jgi:hypothetical protein
MSITTLSPIFTKVIKLDNEDFTLKLFHRHSNVHWFELLRHISQEYFISDTKIRLSKSMVNEDRDTVNLLKTLLENICEDGSPLYDNERKSFSRFGRLKNTPFAYHLELYIRFNVGTTLFQENYSYRFKSIEVDEEDSQGMKMKELCEHLRDAVFELEHLSSKIDWICSTVNAMEINRAKKI